MPVSPNRFDVVEAAALPIPPNAFDVAGGAIKAGADAPADWTLVAAALSCGFPIFANMSPRPPEEALAEGADVPELAGLSNRLNPFGVAAGDATGFIDEGCSCVAFAKLKGAFGAVSPIRDALVVCGADMLAGD